MIELVVVAAAAVAVSLARWAMGRRRQPAQVIGDGHLRQDPPQVIDQGRCTPQEAPQLIKAPDPTEGRVNEDAQVDAGAAGAADPPEPSKPHPLPSTPRVLVGIRPDAGTTIAIEALPLGWPSWVEQQAEGPMQLAGQHVVLARGAAEVVLKAPGQARLTIPRTGDRARLRMGRRARDTLGCWEAWAETWVRWAFAALRGEQLGERAVTGADESGAAVAVLVDLASELEGLVMTAEDGQPERWTNGVEPRVELLRDGVLYSLTIGPRDEDSSWPASVYLYRKDLHLQRLQAGAGEALREVWAAKGHVEGRPVLRAELKFRGDGLRLRLDRRRHRGATDEPVVDLTRLATLADPRQLERAWVHVVGHPSESVGGLYRLIVPSDALPTRCPVDPRWRIVQSAAADAPLEALAQCRIRVRTRASWQQRSERTALRALAEHVALDGIDDAARGRTEAEQRVSGWLADGQRWAEQLGRANAAVGDLVVRPGAEGADHG